MTKSTATIMLAYLRFIDEECESCAQYTAHLRTKLTNEIKKIDKVASAAKLGQARRWVKKHALDAALDQELRELLEGVEQE